MLDSNKELMRRIGYDEGLPVVIDPGIIFPKAFIDELGTQRFPNPFTPTPAAHRYRHQPEYPDPLRRNDQDLHR